jgi:hypothetical protein
MKLGDRVVYTSNHAVYSARIIGELEKEFVIRTDTLIREGAEALWSYHVRIKKSESDQYLTIDPAGRFTDL